MTYDELVRVATDLDAMFQPDHESRLAELASEVALISDADDAAAIAAAKKLSALAYYLDCWAGSVIFRRHVTMPVGQRPDAATLERIAARADVVRAIAGESFEHVFAIAYRQLQRQLDRAKRQPPIDAPSAAE